MKVVKLFITETKSSTKRAEQPNKQTKETKDKGKDETRWHLLSGLNLALLEVERDLVAEAECNALRLAANANVSRNLTNSMEG